MKANWKISASIIVFLIAINIAIYLSFDSLTFLFLSVVFLFGSLSSFFLPTTYILSDEGITVKSVFRKSTRNWCYFKSYYPERKGVFLSPFSQPSRLENFRGLFVRFNNNRTEVIEFVKQKLEGNNL
ncbi:MAG: hypothetical protein ACPL7B_16575 [Candidatus Poribacteria bacterium]